MTRPRPISERLAAKIRVNPETGCHEWIGGKNPAGYGHIWCNNSKQKLCAHRVAYELVNGAIPAGMQIDHLCRNRSCVNPLHLEVVTLQENLRRGNCPSAKNARKTHCNRGHEYTPENIVSHPKGRTCRECQRIWQRRNARAERINARLYPSTTS